MNESVIQTAKNPTVARANLDNFLITPPH